jgi:hypothetical protein
LRRLPLIKVRFMKKLMVALIIGFLLAPFSAWGQKWIESYTAKDGTWVPGHWQDQAEVRKDSYATPGQINPYTGQFNPYTNTLKSSPLSPAMPSPFDPFASQEYQRNYRYRGR